MKTPGEVGVETQSGAVYQALKSEVERNRAKADSMGIIHLGMRRPSSKEADALSKSNPAAQGGVVRIEAYKVDGEITHNGKTYDLKKDAGLKDFRNSLVNGPDKMPKEQADKFIDFLKTQNVKTRDELAQLGMAFFKTGENKMPVNRLVISGHGALGEIWGDKEGELLTLKDVQKLGAIFPKGAEKIEHVAVAACFCAGDDTFETLRSTFPNLKSAFAYNWFSPKAGKERKRT